MNHAPVLYLPPHQQWDLAFWRDLAALCPGWDLIAHEDTLPGGTDGAVVVIPGRYNGALERTQDAIDALAWCLVVISGDEASVYPWDKLRHDRMRLWVQTPRPQIHAESGARFFGVGYTPHTRPLLRGVGDVERTLDWSCAMQVPHKRRRECAEVLSGMDGGQLEVTPGFTQGLPHDEYAALLARTRVVPCPSGPETPDSFRVWEALEAGCIPVADALSYTYDSTGYWDLLLRETPPFPLVHDGWDTFPGILAELLDGWQAKANEVRAWWIARKRQMACDLTDDLAALTA